MCERLLGESKKNDAVAGLQSCARCLGEGETIICDYLFVPVETLLGSTLQSPIIRACETETLAVPFSPLSCQLLSTQGKVIFAVDMHMDFVPSLLLVFKNIIPK